jgi:hypothetical protein
MVAHYILLVVCHWSGEIMATIFDMCGARCFRVTKGNLDIT